MKTENIKDSTINGLTITILVYKETKAMYMMTEKYSQSYGVGLEVLVD